MKTGFGTFTLLLYSMFTYAQITIDTAQTKKLSRQISKIIKNDQIDSAKKLMVNYIQYHERASTRDDSIQWGFALLRMGDRLRRKRYFTDALPYYSKSLPLNYKLYGKSHLNIGKISYNIGVCYADKGYYDKAIETFEKANAIFKDKLGEDHYFVGVSYMAIANTCSDVSQMEKALTFYQKALNIYKAQERRTSSPGRVMNNIGLIHRKLKAYDVAINYFEEALKIYNTFEDEETKYSKYLTYFNLAETYTDQEDISLSKYYYLKVIDFLENNYKNSADLGDSYAAYANVLLNQNKIDSARYYVYHGLKIFHKEYGLKHPSLVTAYLTLGECYELENKLDTAILYYQHALASSMSGFSNIKNIFANPSSQKEITSRSFYQALRYKAQAFKKKFEASQDTMWLQEAIKVCRTADNYQLTKKKLLSYHDQIQHAEEMIVFYEMAVDFSFILYKITENSQYKEDVLYFSEKKKANTLASILSSVKAKKLSGIPNQLLEQEKELAVEITYYNTEILKLNQQNIIDNAKLTQLYDSLFEYTQKNEALIEQLEVDYPKYFQLKYQQRNINSKMLQSCIEDSTVIVSYSIDENQIFIITLSSENFDIKRVPIDYKSFNLDRTVYSLESVLQKKSLIQRRYREKFIFNSNLLYQKLIEPILDKIQSHEKLVIIPEGKLHYVPFDALVSNTQETNFQKMDYLILDYTIINHYSITLYTDFAQLPEYNSGKEVLAVAPVFDNKNTAAFIVSRQHGALIWSEREIEFIQSLYQKQKRKTTLLIREQALEEKFKELLSKNYYKTIHLSSHGFADPEQPDLSWVAFWQKSDNFSNSDNYLHVSEIYNLELNTNLLVLSSCESGIGKLANGEGIISINRGFLYAGALNVVYSIWKINDRYTYELMKNFYSNIFEGSNYAESLRQSKLDMIHRSRIAAMPSNWAGILLLGQ